MLYKNDGYLVCCAVCHKVKMEDGEFIHLCQVRNEDFEYFKLKNKEMRISHTYCFNCSKDLYEQIDKEKILKKVNGWCD